MNTIDLEEYLDFNPWEGKRSRGGGKRKVVNPNSRTAQAKRHSDRENTADKRKDQLTAEVSKIISNITKNPDTADRNLEKYSDWLLTALTTGEVLKDKDITWGVFTTSVKAGGAGRQTSENGRRATHEPTRIQVKAQQHREGSANVKDAREILEQKLSRHLATWQELLGMENNAKPTSGQIEEQLRRIPSK